MWPEARWMEMRFNRISAKAKWFRTKWVMTCVVHCLDISWRSYAFRSEKSIWSEQQEIHPFRMIAARLPTCELQIANCKLQTANCESKPLRSWKWIKDWNSKVPMTQHNWKWPTLNKTFPDIRCASILDHESLLIILKALAVASVRLNQETKLNTISWSCKREIEQILTIYPWYVQERKD
jgi:hypothetical protein